MNYLDTEAEQKYLSLEELGNTLKCLNACLKGMIDSYYIFPDLII